MTDKVKSWWAVNSTTIGILVANLLIMGGFYYGTIRAEIDNKIDADQCRQIVKEVVTGELQSKFSVTDGKILEVRFNSLDKKLDEMVLLIREHMSKK